MKVIDLLNKIANGEIKEEIMFQYNNGYEEYANINTLFDRFTINKENLNTEIEIIEEDKKIEIIEEDKKIEKLDLDKEKSLKAVIKTAQDYVLADKINEIIDYLDKGE